MGRENEKTKMLNRFHVWFPGGIVIGGVLGFIIMDLMGLSWMILAGTLLVPLLIYGFLFFNSFRLSRAGFIIV